MNRLVALSCCTLFMALMIPITGCASEHQIISDEVTFEQLISNPERYNNRNIIVEAFYFHGFETIVLSNSLKYSGYAEGHLVPDGKLIWVEGGIPLEVYNKLDRQQMMGPDERYGKVRIKGKFEHGGSYGHLGGYQFQIIPSAVRATTMVSGINSTLGFIIRMSPARIQPSLPTNSNEAQREYFFLFRGE